MKNNELTYGYNEIKQEQIDFEKLSPEMKAFKLIFDALASQQIKEAENESKSNRNINMV